MPAISEEKYNEVVEMLVSTGVSVPRIAKRCDVSESTVKRIKAKLKEDGIRTFRGNKKLDSWLRKNWHFTGKVVSSRSVTEDGMRVVHKGEKGYLRTPYRPDGRFS